MVARQPAGTGASAIREAPEAGPLLDVRDLTVYYRTGGIDMPAVRRATFQIHDGESVGLVGESGSGKSSVARALMRLIPRPSRVEADYIRLGDLDLMALTERRMRGVRGQEISMVFQEPLTSLNPVLTIRRQITEAVLSHREVSRKQADEMGIEMLRAVGIAEAERRFHDYPFRLSGGMRQRVMVAIALILEPRLLVADEPTTALDVTIQAQILELIRDAAQDRAAATLLITHDLGVVAGMTQRLLVMYAGQIVESGTTDDVFAAPTHPYTAGLLASLPRMDAPRRSRLQAIPGSPPTPEDHEPGCPFAPRCVRALDTCLTQSPILQPVPGLAAQPGAATPVGTSTHMAACWNPITQAGRT